MQNSIAIPWFNDLPAILARVFAGRAQTRATLEVPDSQREPIQERAVCLEKLGNSERPDILVPIDFSRESFEAAAYALDIAQESRSRLILLHVIHLNLTPYGPANPAWLRAALCREALEKMETIMNQAHGAGVPVISVIEEGAPARVIPEVARRWKTDLIVLASHRHGKWARFFGQDIKEKVLHRAECPVVVIQIDARKGKKV